MGIRLKTSYDEYIEKGEPESAVNYKFYFVYTPSGEEHVTFYENSKDKCWKIPIYTTDTGGGIGYAYMAPDGQFYNNVNPVTGGRNSEKADELMERFDYVSQASALMNSLDFDFLANLDNGDAVLR